MWESLVKEMSGDLSGCVSAICAVVSVGGAVVSYLLSRRGRPEALPVVIEHSMPLDAAFVLPESSMSRGLAASSANSRLFQLRNYGDGLAYKLSIEFIDCDGIMALRREDGTFSLFHGGGFAGAGDDIWFFVSKESIKSTSRLGVHWITSPTRLNRCLYREFAYRQDAGPRGLGSFVPDRSTAKARYRHRLMHRNGR